MGGLWRGGGPVRRASADDVMTMASDVGPAPMLVGAVLTLDGDADVDAEQVAAAVADRVGGIPRLHQRLLRTTPGLGRPIWVDDPAFDTRRHVHQTTCPPPGDDPALLGVAADLMATPLPSDRPLWRAEVVSGLEGGRTALVVMLHHAVADGVGGLAVLAQLVDGPGQAAPPPVAPQPVPSQAALAKDMARSRLQALAHLGVGVRRLGVAAGELRAARGVRAARCSLNRPTGGRRRFAVVHTDLEQVHTAAHAHGATVNDVVLCAVGGALHTLMQTRGEQVDSFVVSVPVSTRRSTQASELGNEVGVVPVVVPGDGPAGERLRQVAERMRAARALPRGASTALLTPLFRLLAAVGLFRWFIERQRLVHTFVTNLRGPDQPLTFLGAPVTAVVPLTATSGNVTTSFAVLSYCGDLAIVVIADPDRCPDLGLLVRALDEELQELAAPSRAETTRPTADGRAVSSGGAADPAL